jgi:Glycosyltransferase sugar-binding region containing DXD motif
MVICRFMRRIPRILHYTFGMASDFGGKPWSLVHYVCLKSAIRHIRPEQVYFYCEHEPKGPWWALSRELVTLVKIAAPREIFGRPLTHVAHRSDVVRLQKLIEHGGIYLDADVLVQRDFEDLLNEPAVLGREGDCGTANAVILSQPNAPFLVRWFESYKTFRSNGADKFWNEHSVFLPARLARAHPQEVTLLPREAFFWPLWHDDHLDWIFRSNQPIPLDETYANHLWESIAWSFLQDLTPAQVRARDTNFHRWALPYLEDLPGSYGRCSSVAGSGFWMVLGVGRRRHQMVTYLQSLRKRVQNSRRLRTLKGRTLRVMNKQLNRRQIIPETYKTRLKGSDSQSKFFSGIGPRSDSADSYAKTMSDLIRQHAMEFGYPPTVIDLSCGDFQAGSDLLSHLHDVDITYVGCDIVPELIAYNNQNFGTDRISFTFLDILNDPLPAGDILLVRQVIQHLSKAEIAVVLKGICRYKAVYVTDGYPMLRKEPTNSHKAAGAEVRFDGKTEEVRGVDLSRPPFNAEVVEQFRTFASPNEVIITYQVHAGATANPGAF